MKTRIFILTFAFLLIFNLITPTAILSDGPPPVSQWKGEGTRIKFESIPMITLQKILNRGSYAKTQTISGTLNFPANAADKNVPVVILLSGSSGISDSQEYWIKILNNIGLATFTVDSNWARRKCRSDKENKSFYVGGPFCNGTHKGMLRIVDAYRALELLSKHPRIDPKRIGCLGTSLGGVGCLYQSVKRFQKMWATPGIQFAASVPLYPSCNKKWKEDDMMSDEPIRIHIGDLDQYGSAQSCVKYVERLRLKGKDITVTVYPGVHHTFDVKITGEHGPQTKFIERGQFYAQCNFEENTELTAAELGEGFLQVLVQVGLNELSEKKKEKVFKYYRKGTKRNKAGPMLIFDKSCVTKGGTSKYDREASKKATKLVKDFFITTFKLQ